MGLISRGSSRTYRSPQSKIPTKMKLLTHNFLQSIVKNVSKPYPLIIEASKIETIEVEFSEIAVKRMLAKIDYAAMLSALSDLKCTHELPASLPEDVESLDEDLMKKLHHAMFEIEVQEGNLVCPESQRKYPVMRGIPNMLLTEEEV